MDIFGGEDVRQPTDYSTMDANNKLYFGDNLKILREYVPEASVDLIYLDPPFNCTATYNGAFVAPTFRSAQRDAHLKVGATTTGE